MRGLGCSAELLVGLGGDPFGRQSQHSRYVSERTSMVSMSTRHKRAFVLDDDSGVRDLVEEVLSRCGYTVLPYASPAEVALFSHPENCPLATGHPELFDESPICADLIITDINMPDINGFEFIRKIREVGCKVRYIAVLSGNWTAEQEVEAEALGCKIFHKPFSVFEMKSWVMSLEY